MTAGFVLGAGEVVTPVWNWRKNLGTTIAPETAALLARSLRTLTVRVNAQNASAQAIAARQMHGFGGILTIEVNADGATTTGR